MASPEILIRLHGRHRVLGTVQKGEDNLPRMHSEGSRQRNSHHSKEAKTRPVLLGLSPAFSPRPEKVSRQGWRSTLAAGEVAWSVQRRQSRRAEMSNLGKRQT